MDCLHCMKREVEKDSLFTNLCKECTGQNKLIMDLLRRVFDDIDKLKLKHQGSHRLIDEEDYQRLKEKYLGGT